MKTFTVRILALVLVGLLAVTGCGGGSTDSAASSSSLADGSGTGLRVVTPSVGAAMLASPPQDLVLLDVRTADEFGAGHIEGATMLDFYAEDFADQLAGLDRDVPYVIYCRSGNRSGQTRQMMDDLGFTDVADIAGGISAWDRDGLPLVTP